MVMNSLQLQFIHKLFGAASKFADERIMRFYVSNRSYLQQDPLNNGMPTRLKDHLRWSFSLQ